MASALMTAGLLMVMLTPSSLSSPSSSFSSSVPLCQFTVESFVSSLSSEESLHQQISALLPLCDQISEEEERSHCERNINSYWSYLGPALYEDNLNTEAVYQRICGSEQGTDECDTCKLRVAELALVMTEEEMVDKMTSQVQGDLFCDMEGAWWDVEMCQGEWVWLMPQITSRIAVFVTEESWTWTFCSGPVGVCHNY